MAGSARRSRRFLGSGGEEGELDSPSLMTMVNPGDFCLVCRQSDRVGRSPS
jgi:hypothetical protein